MRILLQRCKRASVTVDSKVVSEINEGLVLFVGICATDTSEDIDLLINKLLNMRIFADDNNKINLSLLDQQLEILSISQYSLYADYRKGRRPSFTQNASLDVALSLYNTFNEKLSNYITTKTGIFQADMQVELVNDGPFTMMLDSQELRRNL